MEFSALPTGFYRKRCAGIPEMTRRDWMERTPSSLLVLLFHVFRSVHMVFKVRVLSRYAIRRAATTKRSSEVR